MSKLGAAIIGTVVTVAPAALLSVPFQSLPEALAIYTAGALALLGLLTAKRATIDVLRQRRGI